MSKYNRRSFLKGAALIGGVIASQTAPPFLTEGLGARPIKWGSIHPTTGPYSTEAFDQVEGVKIAIEDINKEGGIDGRQVKLLFRDDQFKWDQVTVHALDLLDNHRVDFLAGSMVGPEEMRLNGFSKKRKIIYANYPQHIIATPGNAMKMSPLFFTANTTPYQLAASSISYIAENKLGKKIHCLFDDYIWPKMFVPAFKKLTKDFGLDWDENRSISWVPFPTSQDYSATFPRILKEKPDILYALNWGARQVAFIKQMREAGLDKKMKIIIGATEITMPEAAGLGSYHGLNAAMMWHPSLASKYPNAKILNEKFLARRKRPCSSYGMLAHDLTRLILDTARETNLYKPKDHFKLARALEGKTFQYSKGKCTVRPCDHVCISEVFMTRGKSKSEMKDKFDHLEVIGRSGGEANTVSCAGKGLKASEPASKTRASG
jgi:ABC-type branched-subunit amino acid transport system substrate-binding protein